MSICGYNDQMAAGLRLFAEGLAVQAEKRAVDDGIAVADVPVVEITELQNLLDALGDSPKGRGELAGVHAIAMFARFLFCRMHAAGETELSASGSLVKATDEASALFFAMEKHHVEKLRPHFPNDEAMRRLVQFAENLT